VGVLSLGSGCTPGLGNFDFDEAGYAGEQPVTTFEAPSGDPPQDSATPRGWDAGSEPDADAAPAANSCSGQPALCDGGVECAALLLCTDAGPVCTPGTDTCQVGSVCDAASLSCVSCTGCAIRGNCVPPGAEDPANPCLVCQPQVSPSGYAPAPEKPCGEGPAPCSAQDTCDALGTCQPNDLDALSSCGDNTQTACDEADACDGQGHCLPRLHDEGSACEDGFFCTTEEACQSGSCGGAVERTCPTPQVCNETTDRCECQNGGCLIGSECLPNGFVNPANPCDICDPARSGEAYSPREQGTSCGAGGTVCSGVDTCDGAGTCQLNHAGSDVLCDAGNQCTTQAFCDGNGNCPSITPLNGSPCEDGDFCTDGDLCFDGSCFGGTFICGGSFMNTPF
jgi:hypothetical protein